jgi:hypothetical protein
MVKRMGRPPIEGPKRDVPLRVMVTASEARKIKARAKAQGVTVSELLRRGVLSKG